MKHKFLAAPLLCLTLLIFFQPLINGELIKKPKNLIENRMPISAKAAEAAPALDSAVASHFEKIAQEINFFSPQSFRDTVFPLAALDAAREEKIGPELQKFIAQVVEDQPGSGLRGVYIQDVLSLKVEQQPKDNATYVSGKLGTVTQFSSAEKNGVTGLLAHNYLSGQLFYDIALGQNVALVYQDGSIKRYRVTDIQSFQKLTPTSLRSELVDLATGRKYTTSQVFNRFYNGRDHITFQTCLEGQGISNWGLTFFVATPLP